MVKKSTPKPPKLVTEYDRLEIKFQSFDVAAIEAEYAKLDESVINAADTTINGFKKYGSPLLRMRALLSQRSPEHKAVLEQCKNLPTISWTDYLTIAAAKLSLSVSALRDALAGLGMGESASAERQRRDRAENPTPKWHVLFLNLLVAIKTTMDEDNLSDEVSTLVIAADTADLVVKYPLTELELRVPKSQPTEAEKLVAQAAKTAEREANAARKTAERAQKQLDREANAARKKIDRRDGPAATKTAKTAKKKPGRPAGSKSKPVSVTVDHQPTTVNIPWSTLNKSQEEIDAHLATV